MMETIEPDEPDKKPEDLSTSSTVVKSISTESEESGGAIKSKRQRKGGSKSKRKKPLAVVSARRKEAIARARVTDGKGTVRINSLALDAIPQRHIREIISEPLRLAAEYTPKLSIAVNVKGGGVISQAQAVRAAIARGIVEFSGDDDLKKKFLEYDRFLLVDDVRFVEPKKYKGRKARARFQKSYR
jgi:small subunit ribosomal protein S9